MSDNEVKKVLHPPKRRRIINPAAITSVPIYSNKVKTCLQLKPTAAVLAENENKDDSADDSLWLLSPPRSKTSAISTIISDSEEDEPQNVEKNEQLKDLRSPSPPSPPSPSLSPTVKVSRQASKKIREINKQLGAARSILSSSPEPQARRPRPLPSPPLEVEDGSDDVIIVTPISESQDLPSPVWESPLTVREIPLKIRCRTDIHKIPVLSSAPLSEVVDQLSVKLKVPPSCILLLRKEVELPTHQTASELGLGIADIIDCVVMAADDKTGAGAGDGSIITVRLQGKDKGSTQEFSLHREAPLGSILSQYVASMPERERNKVQFHFDGSKIRYSQTPSQLDMEDGDVIEVWT